MNFAFQFGRSEYVGGGGGEGNVVSTILCSRKKQNHNNRREEGTLNMNFAFDLEGMGVGWEGRIVE
jgi:hypothetical protein